RMQGDLRREMDFLPGIDFAQVGQGLKCAGVRIERAAQIAPALDRALSAPIPTVLDVVLDHDQSFPGDETIRVKAASSYAVYVIGTDIGATFTDCAVVDEHGAISAFSNLP